MSPRRYTFDTNVLFYAIDKRSPDKHATAQDLLASATTERACILLQTLGELCHAVGRKRPSELAFTQDWIQQAMVLFDIVAAIPADLPEAIQAQHLHNLPFWDAMLWATARRTGCTLIFTEDLQHGRTLGGVTFRNPFKLPAEELSAPLD